MTNKKQYISRIEKFASTRLGLRNGTLLYKTAFVGLLVCVSGLLLLSGWLPGALLNAALYVLMAAALIVVMVKYIRGRQQFSSHMDEAFRMEKVADGMNSRLVSALDFIEHQSPTPLMSAVIKQTRGDLDYDFESRLDRSRFESFRRRFAVTLVVFLALGVVLFQPFVSNFQNSMFAVSELLFPVNYQLHPGPGRHVYMLGEDVNVSIEFTSRRGYDEVEVLVDEEEEERRIETVEVDTDFVAAFPLTSESEKAYRVRFRFGGRMTEEIKILFSDYPVVENMQTELVYPAYTRMMPRILEGIQRRLYALKNTNITMGFTFSKTLKKATLIWDDGEELPLDTSGRYASTTLVQTRDRVAMLQVVDEHGFELQYPPEITFEVQEDEKPRVFLPGTLEDEMPVLEEELKVFGFGARVRDDFGVTRCVLHWTKSTINDPANVRARGQVERLISPVRRKALVEYMNVFEHISVEPGDRITFWLEAFDNRHPENQSVESPRSSLFVHQKGLDDMNVSSLKFGSDEVSRGRLSRARRQADLKAPEGLRTVQKDWNDYKGEVDTTTMAPQVPADFSRAIKDYFRLMSTAVHEDEQSEKTGQ